MTNLDEYLEDENTPPRAGVFHPSQVGQPCDRLLYLGYNGLLNSYPISPTLQRIFNCGSSLEDRVSKYFHEMGILVDREKPVVLDEPPFSGRIDFIIKHGEYGLMPIELKSINTNGFSKLIEEPKPEHLIQLQLYLHIWNGERETKQPYGTVLYENKNDQSLKAFLIKHDEAIVDQIFQRCDRIRNLDTCPSYCGGDKWWACKGVENG